MISVISTLAIVVVAYFFWKHTHTNSFNQAMLFIEKHAMEFSQELLSGRDPDDYGSDWELEVAKELGNSPSEEELSEVWANDRCGSFLGQIRHEITDASESSSQSMIGVLLVLFLIMCLMSLILYETQG